MKTWMACLLMACVIGNAAAQTTTRGNSDKKQHPECEGQHDCRNCSDDQADSSTGRSDKNSSKIKCGAFVNGAAAGNAGTAGGTSKGITAGVGIAAGVGAIAIGAAAGGGGHHGKDRPSSP